MGALSTDVREQWLLDRANAQFGLLRDADLAGRLGRGAIRSRRVSCRLTRLYPGVYAFGHTALRDEARWLAALWACGADAVLSHATAAAYHGWEVDLPDATIHLYAATDVRHPSLTVHQSRHLHAADVFTHVPFRVTHIPRTLMDLAGFMGWPAYRRLADGLPQLPVAALRAAQRRAPRRPGSPLVSRLIEADDAHTKSEFERRFLTFLNAHRLPPPDHLNHRVAGHKADCVYDATTRLVVELDGRAYHERRAQMRADRHRDTDYQLAGYLILRLVWDDLHADESARTSDRLRRLLRR